jgi:hypothetical protein
MPIVNRNALNQNVFELSLRPRRNPSKAVLGGARGEQNPGYSRFGFPKVWLCKAWVSGGTLLG